MASSLPHSSIAAAVAAANAATPSATVSSAPTFPLGSSSPAEQANSIRLLAVCERLSFYLKDGSLFEASDVNFLCYSLARGIDCAITHNNIPVIASRLPSLVKKVYEWRKNAAFLSAIMMVLISIKVMKTCTEMGCEYYSACKRGWFQPSDSKELLCMVNELCYKFCTDVHPKSNVGHAFDTISKIMPKFYPHLKLCSLIASFEAKPGYNVLMSDFYFPKNHLPEQKIVLIVVKIENLETSSCIAGPTQVSFIINGKGVEKRNNVSLDYGPQFPTDISNIVKYGINVLQAVGYFDGIYLIAVAYMSTMAAYIPPALKEFVHQAVAAFDTDSELIEGPSRISLSCPISFKRIKTPVKGHLCKHHQCFDYANYIEMNSRKPNWRCPHCNQPVCLVDLRIDRNMVKILEEVDDVTEVLIHSDGSWIVVAECEQSTDHLGDGTRGQSDHMECETIESSSSIADPVDLTMEDDDHGCSRALESEDRKPLVSLEDDLLFQFLVDSPLAVPTNIMGNIVITSAVSPAFDATQRAVHAASVMNTVTGRTLPRHVDSTPIAVQALPAQQAPSALERYQAAHASMGTREHFCGGITNMDMHQVTRALETAVMQDLAPQSNNPYVLNSTGRQQVAGLPSPSSINPRPLLSQRMGPTNLDALRATMQPPPYFQNPLRTPPAFRPQPLSPAIRLASPGLLPVSFMNQLNQTQANHLSQLLRSHTASLQQPPREGSRVLGPERWRSLTGLLATPQARTDGAPVIPDQSWRPTRRMRGSLMGSEYSAVLNHYTAPLGQLATTRPPAPPASAADQVAALIANNLMAQATGNQHSGFVSGELGNPTGDAWI